MAVDRPLMTGASILFIVHLGLLSSHMMLAQTETATQPAPTTNVRPAVIPTAPEGMVFVPAGEFTMGSKSADSWASDIEFPQRVVQVADFFIDELEVANIDYKKFIDATGWPPPASWRDRIYREGAEFIPVTEVSWWDATAYARWIGKRLPTEAEWEKAARGTDGRRFPWGDQFSPDLANDEKTPLPVGAKHAGASPYGAIDMAGNVAEWTASVFAPYPRLDATLPGSFGGPAVPVTVPASFDASSATAAATPKLAGSENPQIRDDDPRLRFFTAEELRDERPRSYRGGSFNSYTRFLRATNREHDRPGARWPNVGFRCAADVPSAAGGKP